MNNQPHDWRTIREQARIDGRLLVERCRICNAGRTTTTENGSQVVIATHPDPLPETCPGPHH